MATTERADGQPALSGQEPLTAAESIARQEDLSGTPPLVQTPSQTIGPFFGFALPFEGGPELVPATAPGAIRLHGTVFDGAGEPVPDAILELWQADEGGNIVQEPGSRYRARGVFTGFGRAAVLADGTFEFLTMLPGPVASGARYAVLTLFARGLTHHLITRAYFVAEGEAEPTDALLERVDADRRGTLLARQDGPASYRFDVRIQGDGETVFLDYPGPR